MKKIFSLWLVIFACIQTSAQMKQPAPTVFIYVGETAFPMRTVTSQTEVKQGWDIPRYQCGQETGPLLLGGTCQTNNGRVPQVRHLSTHTNAE